MLTWARSPQPHSLKSTEKWQGVSTENHKEYARHTQGERRQTWTGEGRDRREGSSSMHLAGGFLTASVPPAALWLSAAVSRWLLQRHPRLFFSSRPHPPDPFWVGPPCEVDWSHHYYLSHPGWFCLFCFLRQDATCPRLTYRSSLSCPGLLNSVITG